MYSFRKASLDFLLAISIALAAFGCFRLEIVFALTLSVPFTVGFSDVEAIINVLLLVQDI